MRLRSPFLSYIHFDRYCSLLPTYVTVEKESIVRSNEGKESKREDHRCQELIAFPLCVRQHEAEAHRTH